ncbi:hypothetical protein IscW_ISCW003130 [Ixodes scapularis]|uniref:Uncharacterized protein n=1 Tax=Ixodes scapularis TaxID=6945 RepID=B7P8W5_IXOSC|nr:hypothetical protein IscW_ISCW003130 [Ixodes scapularis]|eukprot:XP_002403285.1 hypothetical protein IscW_ISCW003130 [Ixodes scapularis]
MALRVGALLYDVMRDHALLEVGPLLPLHTRSVTVRTKAGDTLSADSLPCLVPDDLVHGTRTPKSVDRVEENHSELSDIVEELEDEMLENGEQPQQMQHGQPVAMHQQPPQVQGSQMHGSGRREKRNSAGQLIIEPDDALSDKEIYPYYRGPSIPAVVISNHT